MDVCVYVVGKGDGVGACVLRFGGMRLVDVFD